MARRLLGYRVWSGVGTSSPVSPAPISLTDCAGTPERTSASLTAVARRTDSAWLTATEPSVSVKPLTSTFELALARATSAAARTVMFACSESAVLLVSKNTIQPLIGGGAAGGGVVREALCSDSPQAAVTSKIPSIADRVLIIVPPQNRAHEVSRAVSITTSL